MSKISGGLYQTVAIVLALTRGVDEYQKFDSVSGCLETNFRLLL